MAFTNQTHTKTEQELRDWAEEIRQNEGLQEVTPNYTEKYSSLDGLRRKGYIEDRRPSSNMDPYIEAMYGPIHGSICASIYGSIYVDTCLDV